jgi:ribosomal protein S18 acetylase RimI-like enzyme
MRNDEPPVHVEEASSSEAILAASALFDDQPDPAATAAFLADERHHLLIGYIDGAPAGFVSAIELLHPDKPRPEMFVYELGVADAHRGRGVATALMKRVVELCDDRQCGEMFVLTDEANVAAQATYRRAGGVAVPAGVMFEWHRPTGSTASGDD